MEAADDSGVDESPYDKVGLAATVELRPAHIAATAQINTSFFIFLPPNAALTHAAKVQRDQISSKQSF